MLGLFFEVCHFLGKKGALSRQLNQFNIFMMGKHLQRSHALPGDSLTLRSRRIITIIGLAERPHAASRRLSRVVTRSWLHLKGVGCWQICRFSWSSVPISNQFYFLRESYSSCQLLVVFLILSAKLNGLIIYLSLFHLTGFWLNVL